jgi:hypothetical protein
MIVPSPSSLDKHADRVRREGDRLALPARDPQVVEIAGLPTEAGLHPGNEWVDGLRHERDEAGPFRFRDRDEDGAVVKVDFVHLHAAAFPAADDSRPQDVEQGTVADVADGAAVDGGDEPAEQVDGDRGRGRGRVDVLADGGHLGGDVVTGQDFTVEEPLPERFDGALRLSAGVA